MSGYEKLDVTPCKVKHAARNISGHTINTSTQS